MLDQKIIDLNPVQNWSDADLVIIGRPSDGKLFKSTLGDLKAYLSSSAGINRLATPGMTIMSITTSVINFSVSGDIRSEKFIVRLATDIGFTNVIRNTTITVPLTTSQFTGLNPATTYYLDVVAQAAGFTSSLAGVIAAGTSAIVINTFPYSLPVLFN